MSRFLHRPMFRRGGSTGEGITSGLRQGYENAGDVQPNFPAFPEIKLPKSTAGADFWLNFGTNILAQPGGRPLLQTLGTAGKEPLQRYQQQRAAEGQLKYQHQVGTRDFMLKAWEALSDPEKIDMQRKAKLAFENGDFDSYQEALTEFINASIYTKSGYYRPEVQKRLDEEKEAQLERDEIQNIQKYYAEDYYLDDNDAAKYRDFKDTVDGIKGIDLRRDDSVFIDRGSWTNEGGFMGAMDDDGNITLTPENVGSFEEGYAYIDLKTGQGYYRQGPKLMKIVVDEEIISADDETSEEVPLPLNDPFAGE